MEEVRTKKPKEEMRSPIVWTFLATLVFSLLIHLFVFEKSRSWWVTGFSPEGYDDIVPRTFRMKRVEIDPKTLEEQPPEPEKIHDPRPLGLEKEMPTVESAQQGEEKKSLLANPSEINPAENVGGESASSRDLGKGMPLLRGKPETPEIDLTEAHKESALLTKALEEKMAAERSTQEESGNNGKGPAKPGFSSLDDLLAGGAPVSPTTAPILMPTDLLFGYDATNLRPDAAQSLTKLGYLIEKNSGANFRIEGHTDSFGTDSYNQVLSEKRAQEVTAWLVKNMSIDPDRITTTGFGKSRLLVPGTGGIAEQQLNRRVEIVITRKNP